MTGEFKIFLKRMIFGFSKKGAGIEIQPRFKIQYPMKNQNEDKGVLFKNQYVIRRILLINCYVFLKPNPISSEMLLDTGGKA